MTKIIDEELDINYDRALVEFIDANIGHMTRIRPEGFGITVKEYAAIHGVGEDRARDALNELVDKKVLDYERMIIPGKTGANSYVYYRPEDDPVRSVSDGDE